MSEDRKSEVRGVIWDASRNLWRAYTAVKNGKRVYLGSRKTKEEAEQLRLNADDGSFPSDEEKKRSVFLNRSAGIRMRAVWREVTKGDHAWSSFDHFVSTVGDRPKEERKLIPVDADRPLGPDNFQWVKPKYDFMTASGRKSYSKERYASDPNYYRRMELKRKFGITLEEYQEMMDFQGGCCAICNQPETAVRMNKVVALSVDHDHRTNRRRGLLCTACNIAIGALGDDYDRIIAAAAYVKRWNDVQKFHPLDNVVPLKKD
ncbi:MAG: endonuclease VII domain-containing protein [Beijerinckiaceae bacterium]